MTLFTQRMGLSRVLMILAVALGGGALFLASQSAEAANASVSIIDFSFAPSNTTVNVGDTVTWTNNGQAPHTVTSDTGTALDSGTLNTGQTYAKTFDTAGTYSYHCAIHPSMLGVVTVQSTATATATSTTAATATATSTTAATATATSTAGTATATATSAPPTATATPRPPQRQPRPRRRRRPRAPRRRLQETARA